MTSHVGQFDYLITTAGSVSEVYKNINERFYFKHVNQFSYAEKILANVQRNSVLLKVFYV